MVAVGAGLMVAVGFYLSPQDTLKPADAIVVISAGETGERVEEGVKLYRDRWAPVMIMSGAARDEGVSNAAAMRQLAVAAGVPEASIILEEVARDTIGNAQNVQALVAEHNLRSIILVTSPYHQRRALITFQQFLGKDFPIINHSATDSAWRKNGWWLSPWTRHLTWGELGKTAYLTLLFPKPSQESILYPSNS